MLSRCTNKEFARDYKTAYWEGKEYYPTLFERRRNVVGCHRKCPARLHAVENSQVRLETYTSNNTTNTRGVADCMAPKETANGKQKS